VADVDGGRVSGVAGQLGLERHGGGLVLDATDASACRDAIGTSRQRFDASDVPANFMDTNVRKPVLEGSFISFLVNPNGIDGRQGQRSSALRQREVVISVRWIHQKSKNLP
jgi:hypothetical protein